MMNFFIQGGEQSIEKSTKREKFKSSFMVKHRLSLIRRDLMTEREREDNNRPRILR